MSKILKSAPRFYDFAPRQQSFSADVLQGLRATPKQLPSKYFYDDRGSQLFEQICDQDEYYPTRTELSIMQKHAPEMAARAGPRCLLIEYGSGSSIKTKLLLDALQDPVAYVPIDISKGQLLASADALTRVYPNLEVLPICADYTSDFELPEPVRPVSRRVAYFSGSTIGNFDWEQAKRFLHQIAKVCRGGGLLIGVDLQKDFNILHRAYNDAQGVTAQFNKHILERINQELGANFQVENFAHYAFYNPGQQRIEIHLVSLCEQTVQLGDEHIEFRRGESIWTEHSYKYTLEGFARLAASANFTVDQVWTDARSFFSVQYLKL